MTVLLVNHVLDCISEKRKADDVTFHIYTYVKKNPMTLLIISTFMKTVIKYKTILLRFNFMKV